jgi:hypothetical protein
MSTMRLYAHSNLCLWVWSTIYGRPVGLRVGYFRQENMRPCENALYLKSRVATAGRPRTDE